MDISTLLSGAGQVSTGVREREAELRQAHLDQLAVQEANRLDQMRKRMATAPAPLPQPGSFDQFPDQMPVLPGMKPPAAPAAPAPAPKAGVQVRKPPATPLNTVGGVEAVRDNPKLVLTREQFLTLPKSEQQRQYQAYVEQISLANNRERMLALSTRDRNPQAPRPVPSLEEFIAGLPNQRASSGFRRGRPKKAGVAAPGNFALDADTAIQKVLGREGGYVNDPDDAGGETKYGISKASFPDLDIANLTPEQAAQIYKTKYWDAIDADNLPPELREAAFDAAVNQGVPFTRTALANSGRDLNKFLALRKQRYDQIVANKPSQQKFYDGWMARLNEFAGGMSPIATAQADTLPAPVATLAANDGPALREAVAAAGMPAQAAPQPQPQPQMRPEQFYLANPQALSQDMRFAMQQREELVRLATMYQQSGMGAEYMQLRQQVMALDNQLVDLAGMQGIRELKLANDPRRLAQAWSIKEGVPINLQPRTDGTFDVLVNGKVAAQGVPTAEILDTALSNFDSSYRERKGAWADKEYEAQLKIREVMAGETGKMIRELYVAQQKGQLDQALEWFKANVGWDIKGPAGDGTYLIRPPGDSPFYYDPAGGEIEIDGVKVPLTGARRIGGLTTPAGR